MWFKVTVPGTLWKAGHESTGQRWYCTYRKDCVITIIGLTSSARISSSTCDSSDRRAAFFCTIQDSVHHRQLLKSLDSLNLVWSSGLKKLRFSCSTYPEFCRFCRFNIYGLLCCAESGTDAVNHYLILHCISLFCILQYVKRERGEVQSVLAIRKSLYVYSKECHTAFTASGGDVYSHCRLKIKPFSQQRCTLEPVWTGSSVTKSSCVIVIALGMHDNKRKLFSLWVEPRPMSPNPE